MTMANETHLDVPALRGPQQPLPDGHHGVPPEGRLAPPGEAHLVLLSLLVASSWWSLVVLVLVGIKSMGVAVVILVGRMRLVGSQLMAGLGGSTPSPDLPIKSRHPINGPVLPDDSRFWCLFHPLPPLPNTHPIRNTSTSDQSNHATQSATPPPLLPFSYLRPGARAEEGVRRAQGPLHRLQHLLCFGGSCLMGGYYLILGPVFVFVVMGEGVLFV
jgi:hypothetical protein